MTVTETLSNSFSKTTYDCVGDEKILLFDRNEKLDVNKIFCHDELTN